MLLSYDKLEKNGPLTTEEKRRESQKVEERRGSTAMGLEEAAPSLPKPLYLSLSTIGAMIRGTGLWCLSVRPSLTSLGGAESVMNLDIGPIGTHHHHMLTPNVDMTGRQTPVSRRPADIW